MKRGDRTTNQKKRKAKKLAKVSCHHAAEGLWRAQPTACTGVAQRHTAAHAELSTLLLPLLSLSLAVLQALARVEKTSVRTSSKAALKSTKLALKHVY